jgi:hypothetical protein
MAADLPVFFILAVIIIVPPIVLAEHTISLKLPKRHPVCCHIRANNAASLIIVFYQKPPLPARAKPASGSGN